MEAEDIARQRAPRGSKFIHAGGKGMTVRTEGERVIEGKDGKPVKVTTDASGVATQIEEGNRRHAVVRPKGLRFEVKVEESG